MGIRKRTVFRAVYFTVAFVAVALIILKLFSTNTRKSVKEKIIAISSIENVRALIDSSPSSITEQNIYDYVQRKKREVESARMVKSEIHWSDCTMRACFNFDRCKAESFKVYVYPIDKYVPMSSTYDKILKIITTSVYYTQDPSEACLFVLSIDTLNRDELSKEEFVRNLPLRLSKLKLWNNGENHVIFNLYAGTWPAYNETDLGFDPGKAILAKASMSIEQYRHDFDVSIPLFHTTHPASGCELGTGVSNHFPPRNKYTIAFKGKRYVYGIGSETRNSIYHLHNGDDVVMVTTCKHGKNWKEMKDERCDQDNKEYEKFDYESLLANSTFCLVPRGRRLGSFRFIEVLKAGCIPVLLSNGLVLPFSEVIDWSKAAITVDERLLLQTLDIVRSVDSVSIFYLRQQTQILWNQYLCSLEKIVETTFEIIRDRVFLHNARSSAVWNSSPGALSFDVDYADDLHRFPFHHLGNSTHLRENFTAVIYVQSGISGAKTISLSSYSSSPLFRVIKNAGHSKFISKILVVWDSARTIPKIWPDISVPLTIKRSSSKSISQRFITDDEVETDAVFSLDEDSLLTTDELDFAYLVWRSFPDRIVGYPTRTHYWDEPKEQWMYSSKLTNDYSMVLAGGAIYHVYYNHLYWTRVPPAAAQIVESGQNCEDILMNMLVVRVTRKSPIKLTHKKVFKEYPTRSSWNDAELFKERHSCINRLAEIFGEVPLKRSSLRLDPVLFRDPVSNMRKKYRQLER